MDIFLSHIWFILGFTALGVAIGVKFKDQIEAILRKGYEVVLNVLRR